MAFSKCFIFLAHLFLLLSFSAAGHHHHGHHHHDHHHHGHHHHGHHHHDHHHHHHGYHHHGHGHTQEQKPGRISAVYAFGDSSVDTGNNNNNYNTKYRSDHLPYGADFPYRAASGRFSNGRLIVDFIVSSLGIKDALTAYLDPGRTEEDVRTGLSFGLAGTGLDDATAKTNSVPTMEEEVISFEHTVQHMFSTLGEDRTREIIGNALYVISVGTNDMLDTYYNLGSTLWFENVDVQVYHYKLLGSLERVMQRLYRSGARRFMVFGMPPIGCLPSQVETLFSLIPNLLFGAHCVRDHNIDAEGYNSKLQDQLWRTDRDVSDIHVEYVDIYNPMRDIIFNDNNYGFQVSAGSCCAAVGAVPVMGNLCTELTACGNPDAYVFWDSINPSQAANAQLARIIESRVLPKFLG